MANDLATIDASNLTLWQLLKPVKTGRTHLKTIKSFQFPDCDSSDAFEGDGTVRLLGDPSAKLSRYWPAEPTEGHLHVIAQLPKIASSECPTCRWMECCDG